MPTKRAGTTLRNCDWCGSEYAARNDMLKLGYGRYCGRPCHFEARKRRVTRTCQICGEEFETLACKLNDTKVERAKYCSAPCRHEGRKLHRRPLEERFWEKVDRRGDDECWPWTGAKFEHGYGKIGEGGAEGRDLMATRVSWELAHGRPVPDDLEVIHTCDFPPCVNPAHLLAATHLENMRDKVAKGRQFRGQTAPLAKFTDEEVLEMRRLYDSGELTCKGVADKFGTSMSNAHRIVKRKRWTHLP